VTDKDKKILCILVSRCSEWTPTEIGIAVNASYSSTRRILNRLVDSGLAERVEECGHYRATRKGIVEVLG
jgi:predicted transcriptional regulator